MKSVKCTRSRVRTAGRKRRFPSSPMEAGRSTAVTVSRNINQKDTSEEIYPSSCKFKSQPIFFSLFFLFNFKALLVSQYRSLSM